MASRLGHGSRFHGGSKLVGQVRGSRFHRGSRFGSRGYYGGRRYATAMAVVATGIAEGLSGADAALIAGGVIGGAIILDQALDSRDRRRFSDQRFADSRFFAEERARLDAERRLLEEDRRLLEEQRRVLRGDTSTSSSSQSRVLEEEMAFLEQEKRRLEEDRKPSKKSAAPLNETRASRMGLAPTMAATHAVTVARAEPESLVAPDIQDQEVPVAPINPCLMGRGWNEIKMTP